LALASVAHRIRGLHRDGVRRLVAEKVLRLVRLAMQMTEAQRGDEPVGTAPRSGETAAEKQHLGQGRAMKCVGKNSGSASASESKLASSAALYSARRLSIRASTSSSLGKLA